MKFDELEIVEVESFPKNNVVIEDKPTRQIRLRNPLKGNYLNIALSTSIMSAGVAVVTLGTTLVAMAMNGVLADVFKTLIS